MSIFQRLIGIIRIDGAEESRQKVRSVRTEMRQLGVSMRSLATFGGLAAVASSIDDIARALSSLSGVSVAARFERIEIGLTNILDSADLAKGAIKELIALGTSTEFKTEGLVGLSKLLIATGSDAKSVVREIRAISDATSFVGGGDEVARSLALNLSQIRNSLRPELRDLKEFGVRGINLSKVVGGATGKTVTQRQAIEQLQGMGGEKAFATIISGMEKAFGGSAQKNASSLLGIMQNLSETFEFAMLPTGKLLMPIVKGIADGFLSLGKAFGRMNEATGGTLGLAVLVTAGAAAIAVMATAAITATTAVTALSASLAALTGTSLAAGATAAGGAAVVAGGAGVLAAGAALLTGLLTKGLGITAGIGLAYAGEKLSENIKRDGGGDYAAMIPKIGGYALGGGAIGATFGGLPGAIIGTAIGTTLGALKTMWDYSSGNNPATQAAQETAKNTEKMAQSLEIMQIDLKGGGRRSRDAIARAETAMYVRHALSLGFG